MEEIVIQIDCGRLVCKNCRYLVTMAVPVMSFCMLFENMKDIPLERDNENPFMYTRILRHAECLAAGQKKSDDNA